MAPTNNNDTECVNGPGGNAADHLTKDVRPYVISQFGASADAANWGVVGWSMGGTCAVDLTVMHAELFSAFVDIAGDAGRTAGTNERTIARPCAGGAARYDLYDPRAVMARHGPYSGVARWFADTIRPAIMKELMKQFGGGKPKNDPQQSGVPMGRTATNQADSAALATGCGRLRKGSSAASTKPQSWGQPRSLTDTPCG